MADEYYNNKIVTTDGDVLMDLTQDTATPEAVLEGETFHLRSGAPATGTYRPSDEIEARLRATVGHTCKNLLNMGNYNLSQAGANFSNIQITESTGSLSFTATGINKALNYTYDALGLEPNNATYIISCINNVASTTRGRLAVRTVGSNVIKYETLLSTTGAKKLKFTADSETFPDGWYISIMATGSTSTTGNIDISNLMLREASISDDNFEPYVTPTDDRIVDLEARVAALEAIINNR